MYCQISLVVVNIQKRLHYDISNPHLALLNNSKWKKYI